MSAPLSKPGGSLGSTIEISEIESLTLGSLIVGDGSGAPSELSVGSNGAFLQALSSEATGMIWRTSPQLVDSIDWTTGVAVDPTAYQILRDNSTNNRLILNAPSLRDIGFTIAGSLQVLVGSTTVLFTQDINVAGDIHVDNTAYFRERSGDPATFGDEGGLYTKETGGVTELYYIDSSGSVTQLSSGGAPSVVGPASSTDNAIVRWDGTTGGIIQDYTSGAPTISDTGAITATQGGSLTGTWSDLGVVTTVDINGGTIDGVTIGGSVAAAGTFTAIVGTSLDLNGALDLDVAALGATITNTADAASSQVIILEGDRASFADNDEAYISLRLSNDAGTQLEFARITWVGTDVNVATDEDGRLDFAVRTADVLANELSLTGAGLYPSTGDGLSLGISGTAFSDLYLANGALIDFAGGDVTWTHTSGTMTFSGDLAGDNAASGQFLGDAAASATVPTFAPNKTDTNSGIGAAGADQLSLIAGGAELIRLTEGLTGVTGVTMAQQAGTSGTPTALLITGAAHTGITAATESIGLNFDFSATKTWASGAGPLAIQREIYIQAPTYNGNAAGALTITNAATVHISGAPIQGTNMTLSNTWALWVDTGNVRFDGDIFLPTSGSVIDFSSGDVTITHSANALAFAGASAGITFDDAIAALDANGWVGLNEAASGTNPTLAPNRADTDTGLGSAGADQLSLIAGAVQVVNITEAGASGNTVTIAGGTLTSGGTSDETLDITATLNDSGVAGGSDIFTMVRANLTVTDATGWDNVYLFDFQVGGSSRILYDRTNTRLQLGSSAATQIDILAEDQGSGNNTAGRPLLIAAGAAGSQTTGAAGGALFLEGGNAGGSDNNNGGNINLTAGTATGSGQAGVVNINQPGGTPGTDAIAMTHDGTNAVFINLDTGGDVTFGIGAGNTSLSVSAESVILANDILIRRDVNAGLTASTTQTQGNGALTAEVNEVATVANTNDTVTLPTAVAGLRIVILNNGANTLQIFPASGDNLGAGVDTATTLASGSNVVYQSYNDTNWESI